MKTLDHILLKLSAQWVRNGSVQFTAMLHLEGLFVLSARGGAGLLRWVHPAGPCPWSPRRRSSRRGGRVELHKGDGRQLLAELLQHDDALQQRDVVDTAGREQAVNRGVSTRSSLAGISREKPHVQR